MRLTRSDYLRYLKCPKYAWVYKHNPARIERNTTLATQQIREENDKLQRLAQRLFPGGKSIRSNNIDEGHKLTQNLIQEGSTAIFRATATTEQLSTYSDIIQRQDDSWDIIEIHSAGRVQQKYLYSLAFQRYVWRQAGLQVGRLKVGYINKAYVKGATLDPHGLLTITDVTDEVDEMEINVDKILADVTQTDEPQVTCHHPRNCPIPELCWSELPTYSIYDIPRLSPKKLKGLRDKNILNIQDVPDNLALSPKQQALVKLAKSGQRAVNHKQLAEVLNNLKYPLYFLDYEAFGPALPAFEGHKPYQKTVFQYSLHIINQPGSKFEHKSFLIRDLVDPTQQVIESLTQNIGLSGHIVVWHKTFEMDRHREMAERHPQHSKFMHSLNQRIFDLRDVFENQLYLDPRFRGSTSIKNILPVLAPELSYKQLPIHEGTEAAAQWYLMVAGKLPLDKQERIYNNLAQYCYLDTLAMVKIFERLLATIQQPVASA